MRHVCILKGHALTSTRERATAASPEVEDNHGMTPQTGPLRGTRVIEMAGIGPAPMCGMLLADMGAEVVRIDRLTPSGLGVDTPTRFDVLNRGKSSVALDLKGEAGRDTALALIAKADALIEGFRPGVMERMGLGPEACHAVNPRLVYGRMTGWGQDGPLAPAAGHDLNYIALTGALHAIPGPGGKPAIPLNLLGDFGGGTLYLAMGVLAALNHAARTGEGQIVDAAIVDGVASLMSMHHALMQADRWPGGPGQNLLDGGAPFYDIYATSDGKWVTVGALEPKFYATLIDKLDLDPATLPDQYDRSRWDELRAVFAKTFASKTRDEWCALLEGTDSCFAPVLDAQEVTSHPHMAARGIYRNLDGVTVPGPAPRFDRTPAQLSHPPREPGADTDAVLARWGIDRG